MVFAFVRLGRPRFLAGGFVLHAAGTVLARPHLADIDGAQWALGQCGVTLTQLMTHYSNDYFDVEADRLNRDSTRWSGGSRVLADGELSPQVARNGAFVFGALAIVVDVVIALTRQSPNATLLLVLALLLSWSYSAPPLRLHHRGFGPLTAGLVVGALTPLIGYAMQHGAAGRDVWVVAPLVVAQAALIVILDLPDAASDAAARKMTLAVRLGTTRASQLAIALVFVTYLLVLWLFDHSRAAVALAMALTLPAGGLVTTALMKKAWAAGASGSLTSRAVVWFASLSAAALIGALFGW